MDMRPWAAWVARKRNDAGIRVFDQQFCVWDEWMPGFLAAVLLHDFKV
jgi:hypothetical protein